ncbi:MAG: CsgG/HfaB family protein [Saprospiraceae bacterium]
MRTTNEYGKFAAVLVLICIFCSSCSILFRQPIQPTRARLGEETQSTIELKTLPEPKEPIVVAVYKFRDQTGQYKPSETGANWSTAVTQGATSILIKALENSNWFVPIERENVGNLLNERKIIRSSRAQYGSGGESKSLLPPLLFAGLILEGGIVSYDANVITGGAGLRYFGAGASGQYRQDRVTVYLRAISTSNGKILKSVYTSKTILSQKLDAGLFRYVQFQRLLEVETGFSYNEPSELAVTEAIEKAVISLIIEGIDDGLWELDDSSDTEHRLLANYWDEKEQIPQTDIFGKNLNNRRRDFSIGVSSSSLRYAGDYPNPNIRTGMQVDFANLINPYVSWGAEFGFSQMSTDKFYQADVTYLNANLQYRFSPYNVLTPYAYGGFGFITENEGNRFNFGSQLFTKAQAGFGFEYIVNNTVGIKASAGYNYVFSDELDDITQGRYNDFYWSGNIGINVYFGDLLQGKRRFDYKQGKK